MKQKDIMLDIGSGPIVAEGCEPNYWLGTANINGLSFHVELIEVKLVTPDRVIVAKNPDFQNRIEAWFEKNEGERPKLLRRDSKTFFVHVEVFAE